MDRKKYEFTGETRALSSTTILHRIRAVIDIPSAGVNAGDIGGWIESDSNLSLDNDAWVGGSAWVFGNARVSGDAWGGDDARVSGSARVVGDAHINSNKDFIVIGPIGSRNGFTTFYKNKDENVCVRCGCFSGTVDEFLAAVQETHGDNRFGREYRIAAELAKAHILEED